jgi:large subunit ribosomal protein L3
MKALLAKKIGMTQIFAENGASIPVTVLDVSNNYVSKLLKEGETVTHIELGKDTVKKPTKSEIGNYTKLNFVPRFKKVFKIGKEENLAEEGAELKADVFAKGDKVSISGVTKGKGFQGVVKRWGFAGGPKTHGASDRERAPGSLGTRTIPGRIFKGKKMGGHMGVDSKTLTTVKIALVDVENNLIAVQGSIPGAKNSYIVIKGK